MILLPHSEKDYSVKVNTTNDANNNMMTDSSDINLLVASTSVNNDNV